MRILSVLAFILYNLTKQKVVANKFNPHNRYNERIAPDSTFKIVLSLIAFNKNLINQDSIFQWDRKKYDIPEWNRDQTPQTWLKYSIAWVSQQIAPELGLGLSGHI